jgi:4-hydroxy-4-methyl-2-oxoglutarate aldolase
MRPRVRAIWRGARLVAPAFPVQCSPGDNLPLHVAVARAPEGSALAVDVGGEEEFGYWGEVLTTAAEARGVRGLVIDGGVRDTAALEAHGFPVFATTTALPGATKRRPGAVGAPADVGGVRVAPGDWLVGDADGVVVVAHAALDDVIAAGRARDDKERRLFEDLRRGRTTLELLDLDPSAVEGG